MEDRSIIHKIRKLIEKSKSTDSIYESESLMIQAQKLLQKYNLEQSHVESFQHEGNVTETSIKFYDRFEVDLMNCICENNFCFLILDTDKLIICGKHYNIESVLFMFSFFKNRLLELSIVAYSNSVDDKRKKLAELGVNFDLLKGKATFEKNYISEYLTGGVDGIRSKMIKQLESEKDVKSLIVINNKEIQKYVSEKYKTKTKTVKTKTTGEAYNRGFADGINIKESKSKLLS